MNAGKRELRKQEKISSNIIKKNTQYSTNDRKIFSRGYNTVKFHTTSKKEILRLRGQKFRKQNIIRLVNSNIGSLKQ